MKLSAVTCEYTIQTAIKAINSTIKKYDQVIEMYKHDPNLAIAKGETLRDGKARIKRLELMVKRMKIGLMIFKENDMTEFTLKKLELLMKQELTE